MTIKTSKYCGLTSTIKVTPNEAAKLCIMDTLENAFYSSDVDWEGMTQKESRAVCKQINKRIDSIRRVLGIDKLEIKIEAYLFKTGTRAGE